MLWPQDVCNESVKTFITLIKHTAAALFVVMWAYCTVEPLYSAWNKLAEMVGHSVWTKAHLIRHLYKNARTLDFFTLKHYQVWLSGEFYQQWIDYGRTLCPTKLEHARTNTSFWSENVRCLTTISSTVSITNYGTTFFARNTKVFLFESH